MKIVERFFEGFGIKSLARSYVTQDARVGGVWATLQRVHDGDLGEGRGTRQTLTLGYLLKTRGKTQYILVYDHETKVRKVGEK